MKLAILASALVLVGCAQESVGGDRDVWVVGKYKTAISHVPDVTGYTRIKSAAVEFRKYEVSHPGGLWIVALDGDDPPITITPKGGKKVSLAGEWYPLEGGADAAAVYAFVKGDETLLILQGTSDITSEETWVRFSGTKMTGVKRYAAKGIGMGTAMPGMEPEHKTFPLNEAASRGGCRVSRWGGDVGFSSRTLGGFRSFSQWRG